MLIRRGHGKYIMIIKIRVTKLVGEDKKVSWKSWKEKKGKMYISFWMHRIGIFLIFPFLRLQA